MKDYRTVNLRNIGIIGHSGSGKTTLAEAILYYTNCTDRFGKIGDGNTVSDYDLDERKRKISIFTSILPCYWGNTKINLLDMPGYFDFVGECIEGLRATDIAIIVASGTSGIQVGTEKAWNYINEKCIPRAIYINKLDRENSSFDNLLKDIQSKFGMSVVPIQYPIGREDSFRGVINVISRRARIFNNKTKKMEITEIPDDLLESVNKYKEMIMESVAETDDKLLEKYFSNGYLSDEEICLGLVNGVVDGDICPVMCGSAIKGIGIETLLEDIIEIFPSPDKIRLIEGENLNSEERFKVDVNDNAPFSAFIFKTVVDPFIGRLSIFKVMSGNLKSDTVVLNANKNKEERITSIYFLRGKQQILTKEIIAGDIGAVAKLQYSNTGDTLCDLSANILYNKINFPKPAISMAALPKTKTDEEKISLALNKLMEQDPTFTVSRDIENAETIISGIGQTHLDVIASKIKNDFGAEIVLENPKIPYRETIKKVYDVRGKYKKQSGGHGQYGDVVIKFEHGNTIDDLDFVDKIVGGVVPKQYIPAVEKGLRECIKHGVLAGYPVIGLRATLHDGSYHPVDSSEMAFKVAASVAYKKGMVKASPVLLEPIMRLEVLVTNEYMGDVITDINKKRGRILGMEQNNNMEKIIAEVPQSELCKYATDLRSITQARGNFNMHFKRYEEVPEEEAKIIVEKRKNRQY